MLVSYEALMAVDAVTEILAHHPIVVLLDIQVMDHVLDVRYVSFFHIIGGLALVIAGPAAWLAGSGPAG